MEALTSALDDLEALGAALDEGLREHPPLGFKRDDITAWMDWSDERGRLLTRLQSHESDAWRHLGEAAASLGCALQLDALARHAPEPVAHIRTRLQEIREKTEVMNTQDAHSREFLTRARLLVRGYLDAMVPRSQAYGRDGAGAPSTPPSTTSTRV